MNTAVQSIAAGLIVPKVVSNFKWRWLAYGVAAYYGLKFLKNNNVLPQLTGPAVDLIDHGIDKAKEAVGLKPNLSEATTSAISTLKPKQLADQTTEAIH